MSKKLTPWFPGDVKPTHVGVYQTKDSYGVCYQYWTGRFWGFATKAVEAALLYKDHESNFQNDPWRGLAKKP